MSLFENIKNKILGRRVDNVTNAPTADGNSSGKNKDDDGNDKKKEVHRLSDAYVDNKDERFTKSELENAGVEFDGDQIKTPHRTPEEAAQLREKWEQYSQDPVTETSLEQKVTEILKGAIKRPNKPMNISNDTIGDYPGDDDKGESKQAPNNSTELDEPYPGDDDKGESKQESNNSTKLDDPDSLEK